MKVYKRYENATFENYQGNTELVKILSNADKIKDNIIIIGGVGTGKTHLAYAMLNKFTVKKKYPNGDVYYRSNNIRYATVKEIIDDIRKSWKNDETASDKVKSYKTAQLLIIDEIGVQYGSDSERIELFEIFNERYNNILPIIAISNYHKPEIEKILGLRITDRLFGGARVFEIEGRSKRCQNA